MGRAITDLAREEVLSWFGGKDGFAHFHNHPPDEAPIRALIEDDLG